MACSASIVLYSRPPVFLWRLWNHSIPLVGRIGLPISFLLLGVVLSVLHSIFCIGVGSGWPFPVLGSGHSWVSPSNACGPCNLLVFCGLIAIVVGSVLLFVVGLHTAGSHVAGGGLHQCFWWTVPIDLSGRLVSVALQSWLFDIRWRLWLASVKTSPVSLVCTPVL